MSIQVQTNKNIIFFEVLLSLMDKHEYRYPPLGEEIAKEFKYIKELKSYKIFAQNFNNGNITKDLWSYLLFAIYTNENFILEPINSNDSYIVNDYENYQKDIYPMLKRILEESDFYPTYEKKYQEEYQEVCNKIQKKFDKYKPEKILLNFWENKTRPKLIFIPNLLRVGGGSGLSRNNQFYAIIGASNNEGELLFKPSNMISSLYHEFSHSFFKKNLFSDSNLLKENGEICNNLSPKVSKSVNEKILQNYGSSTIYFEETFVRAIQILLTKEFFVNVNTGGESFENEIKRKLESKKKEGFIYIYEFYNALENSKDNPMQSYIRVLKSF